MADIFGYVIGGVAAVVAAPVVLGAVGFTGAGIAAGSVAAKMMSAAAIANGGGVAAGSLVATLQSAGAAGLSASSNALLGAAGSAMGGWLCGSDD
ncbi:interferon alpha-inducible protein 27-like protein 2A isoform X3 [Talpa occidentalis]|nr:interferon alpha-inducible protein 27-like protein 2A isoform X3 [Talpa occidentalis]XP_037359894.1 interferon alpha-inducible protein 27-like protein 2A isoform X3 [Talpa occidentalis]XP_054548742.1 interferon alpha-inducible protein 27-like protein 2A isoform X3 [Talpa occidentalis]